MHLDIFPDYESLSASVADQILDTVKLNPEAVLCLATGDTPRLAYSLLVKKAKEGKISFANCTFVALDEWLGVPPDNEGSCHHFLWNALFSPLDIPDANINLFDGLSPDPDTECKKMDSLIRAKGGIDLMLVGIGMNGHIGFNEPGEFFHQYAHVAELHETSKSVGQKYFQSPTALTKGITLGISHMLETKKVLMVANGIKKAEIIKKTVENAITPHLPATAIKNHANGNLMIDEEAASMLVGKSGSINN